MLGPEDEWRDGCPDEEALEAALTGGAGARRAHIDGCDDCQRRLEGMRRDRELLGELATARGRHDAGPAGLGPSTLSVDEYELLGELHRGGQGVVYRALQKSTNRVVAFKMLL